jgi:WD40 repeat protein
MLDSATGKVVRTWVTDQPLSPLAFSPDGATLAAGITQWGPYGGSGKKPSGGVQLWDVERGTLIRSIPDDKPVTFIAFSPDGKSLATSSNDGPMKLWDLATGQIAHLFPGRGSAVFAPDDTLVCIAGKEANKLVATIERYQLRDAALVRTLTSEPGAAPSWLLGLDVSADGKRVAAADWNSLVTVWSLASGERERTSPITWAAQSPLPSHPTAPPWRPVRKTRPCGCGS